ncbi:MAG: tyrosine-type recombinase/integrase [bacterium]|nr:tyrosine-type recombinase/integrase [bacterium]
MPKNRIEQLLTQYLEYLEVERGRSAKTVENYHHYLRDFLETSGIVDPEAITLDVVRKYRVSLNRRQLRRDQTLKRVTQNYYVIAVRGFLKYCAKIGVKSLAAEQVELGKQEDREVSFLEWEEIERLLAAPKGDDIAALRDRAMLETLFSTGLRVSELTNLNRNDISTDKGEFSVRGKGGKIRVVFLSDRAKTALKTYMEKRADIDRALFVRFGRMKPGSKESKLQHASDDLRLTPRSVERMVHKYAAEAGIAAERVVPHTMRHSFATNLLRNGADIRSVQALLGHSSITTTQIYTHVTDKQLREIYKKFHGKK